MTVGLSATSDRYTVHRVDNRQWGGVQWAIWDNKIQTWADDLGRWLTEEGAQKSAAAANRKEAFHA